MLITASMRQLMEEAELLQLAVRVKQAKAPPPTCNLICCIPHDLQPLCSTTFMFYNLYVLQPL